MTGSGRSINLHKNLSERCIAKEHILFGAKIRRVALLVTAISPEDQNFRNLGNHLMHCASSVTFFPQIIIELTVVVF